MAKEPVLQEAAEVQGGERLKGPSNTYEHVPLGGSTFVRTPCTLKRNGTLQDSAQRGEERRRKRTKDANNATFFGLRKAAKGDSYGLERKLVYARRARGKGEKRGAI